MIKNVAHLVQVECEEVEVEGLLLGDAHHHGHARNRSHCQTINSNM